ncbi:type I-E CRISPR-associated protein Cas6/Cse3/CasE [Nonomuraea sp. SMC257]|uniref:Type I-E CRISPR-associated protein Cas6/Cse3/CasE n=1 Tax=Nonomuraea montanisoli TaxID=2741721 RepID=A0A7Y6I8W4_9ACTN|nr:type I-E CRISPR-associated protein Cas6/Cse3/CasE [Nonomuraea montanisoli]NUW33852.1 type I-E CRISPR-associated protein Cas6/Cse3/CasE [Nonomuraea montanisoli]
MYLTRFRLNTARVGARRLLSSPQILHAAVMSSFADIPAAPDGGPRVLWRVDRNSRAETYLYIVSPDKPDLTHLVEQGGWPETGRWDTYGYEPLLSRLAAGDRWAFRLTANPVHSIRRKDGEPTKVTAHVTQRHQIDWLLKHQEKAGFKIIEKSADQQLVPGLDRHEVVVHDRRQLSFAKRGQKAPVTLLAVTFDGRLEVTDPDALRHALTRGLGRAKSYGCGLMTLAEV